MVGEDDDSFDDGRTQEEEEEEFNATLRRIKANYPQATALCERDDYYVQNITDDGWEELGRGISNNIHLTTIVLANGALNDHRMSFLFRGLTRSSSIKEMWLYHNELVSNHIERMQLYKNGLSAVGVQNMVPFLQNATNLRVLTLDGNNIQSEGFNTLFRALHDSPIETLDCNRCGIESIEIDSEHIPTNLKSLGLTENRINSDGCRDLATLLRGGDDALEDLYLGYNNIDDDGVEFLVDALQNNTSLTHLSLTENDGISNRGQIMLLKLVNDVSSIKATLQSNHTLKSISVEDYDPEEAIDAYEIQRHIDYALGFNNNCSNPEAAGREKVIQTHLHSATRATLCRLQGVDHCVCSQIDPLQLPEVLSKTGRLHGQGELYVALLSSIMALFSTVNVKECIQQKKAYHEAIIAENAAIVAELDAKLASMEQSSKGNESNNELEHRSNKRRRKWWWGLWGGAC